MADMNIRDVTDVTLAAWKKAAIDEGKSLKQWVTEKLDAASGRKSPDKITEISLNGRKPPFDEPVQGRDYISEDVPASTKPNKVIARTVRGTREHNYFLRYAKENNEFPSAEELQAYMEERDLGQ